MLDFLKDHPFPVTAYFESSLVLTFAVPKSVLQDRIPGCLTLDTYDGKWAFIAAALVQTKDLRPKGFPRIFGNDFFLIGYRIFVRFETRAGKRLRGLYILKSETDKARMNFFGNIFTHYNYQTTDIEFRTQNGIIQVQSNNSGILLQVDSNDKTDIPLPEGSPFPGWKEARRFAGPLPFTFNYNEKRKYVLVIEGMREHWQAKPVLVQQYRFDFIDKLDLPGIKLANAFLVEKIPYEWKKGRKEKWQ